MTTTTRSHTAAPSRPAMAPTGAARPPAGGGRSAARLYVRLVRRSALWLSAAMAGYLVIEVVAFRTAYPDSASREALLRMADNAAVRMLQGAPHGIDDTGAYVAWDAGWMIQSIVAVWALIVTTRLLRGEEDADRAALVLTAPLSPARLVVAQVGVLAAAAGLVGTACAAALLVAGTAPFGALLFGAGVAGSAAVFTGVAAVCSQLAPSRRRALGLGASVLAAAFLLRMIAYSTESRAWLRWLTPYGWVDELRPYDADQWWALAPAFLTAAVLFGVTPALRGHRDTGAALLAGREDTRSRLRLLGGPTGLAWRLNAGVLLGWLTGVAVYAGIIGALSPVVTELSREDPDYERMLERFGMEAATTEPGFVAFMGPTIALMIALYVAWRIGAARTEEATGHLETLLARPVTRRRWLVGHALLALAGAAVLATGAAVAIWVGARTAGADVGLNDALVPVAAQAPLVAVFAAVAVLMLGLAPRLTTALPAALVVVAYLVQTLGPAMKAPEWILAISPFHHLGYVPIESFRVVPALVLVAVAAAAATVGSWAFERRDVAGA